MMFTALLSFFAVFALLFGEQYLMALPFIQGFASTVPLEIPRLFALVILVNVIGVSFLMIGLGAKVGAARKAAIEKGKKDGDAFAEQRYSYPKLYAEGFSNEAKLFNCVQRGHQHALETVPMFIALSLIGGVSAPLVTVFGGLLYIVARLKWAAGYASGEPSKRYTHSRMGFHIWTSVIIQVITSCFTVFKVLTQ